MKIEFTHWRLPNDPPIFFEYKGRGAPDDDHLIEYSKGNGFYVSNPGDELYKFDGVKPYPRGGKTVCRIIDDSGKTGKLIAIGVAVCSMSDNFSYRIGREIAVGRAVRAASDYAMLEEFAA